MTRATIVVRPDGRAILAISEPISQSALVSLRERLVEWETSGSPIVVIPDCAVVQVKSFDLDLEPAEVPA